MAAHVSGDTKGHRSATGKLCIQYDCSEKKKEGRKHTKFDRLRLILLSNDPAETEAVT